MSDHAKCRRPQRVWAIALLCFFGGSAGCEESRGPGVGTAADQQDADGAVADVQVDAGSPEGEPASNDGGAQPLEAGCRDVRRFNDRKQPDDSCWEPPAKYCAQGAGQAITVGCSPDGAGCCTYGNTCMPCGFIECTQCVQDAGQGIQCPEACSAPRSQDPIVCR